MCDFSLVNWYFRQVQIRVIMLCYNDCAICHNVLYSRTCSFIGLSSQPPERGVVLCNHGAAGQIARIRDQLQANLKQICIDDEMQFYFRGWQYR
jgi:hypothetical protein